MNTMQIDINKVRIIDKQSAFNNQLVNVTVVDGYISSITPVKASQTKGLSTILADGKEVWKSSNKTEEIALSPGWVDLLADYCEPGFEHKEDLASGLQAAAGGGFTDVLLAPNTQPAVSSKSIIQYIRGCTADNIVNLHPMGTASQNAEGKELAEMMDMQAAGAIAFTDGWKPIQNANLMLKALEYVKPFCGIIIQLPIDASLATGGLMNEGIVSTGLGMPGVPELAETLMIYRDIELLRYTGSRLHIAGVTTGASIALIRKAKAEGLALTCSVTPYHLVLTDEMLTGYDSVYKVSPPLRGESDRMALIAALADGTIDCIAAHHQPHDWDAKAREFEYAASGIGMQESVFPVLWDALKEYVSIELLTDRLGSSPRRIFGLPDATIAVEHKASFTIFNTQGQSLLTASNKKSKGVNNPFIGSTLAGKVIGILNNNQLASTE